MTGLFTQKNPRKSTKKLELIGILSKISGYRSTLKNCIPIYRWIKKQMENAIKNGKNTICNLVREVKTVYFKNCSKTRLKDIKD